MKKPILIIGGIVVLVLLLASAAFVGGRLLNGQGLPGVLSGIFLGEDGRQGVKINLDDIQPAKELPQTPADVHGIFDHRQDQSLFIGTGQGMIRVEQDPSGNVTTDSSFNGPVVEIVVTSQTIIYKDVTMNQYNGEPPAGQNIQQVVEPGSLDDIGKPSGIFIWGRKTGDRFIADVLVYSSP